MELPKTLKGGNMKCLATLIALIVMPRVYLFSSCAIQLKGTNSEIQRGDKPPKDSIIIKESTVLFLRISPEDLKSLITRDPTIEDGLTEVLSDFIYYSEMISQKLAKTGIDVKSESWKEIWIQVGGGKLKKIVFNPELAYGMVLYVKGEVPKLETKFSPDFFTMGEMISEFFHIKIRW